MGPVDDDVISLEDYRQVLRRQRVLVVVTTVVVVMVAVGASFAQTPLYEGEAEVVLERVRRTQDVSLEDLLMPAGSAVETERRVITSRPVVDRVADELGMTDRNALLDQVRTETVRDTRVVRIVATDPDPARAASIANAFSTAYLDLRRTQAVDEVLEARADLEQRAAAIRAELEELEAAGQPDPVVPESVDPDDPEATPADPPAAEPGESVDDLGARVQREVLLAQLAQVAAQIADLAGAADAITGGGAVLTPAEVATTPVSPRPMRTGALAVVLGLMLGIGFAFLRDHLDDVIRDEADFKRSTGGPPVLGRIPVWEDPEGGDRLVTIVEPSSVSSESYRELLAGVRFLLAAPRGGQPPPPPGQPSRGRSIMVTSAVGGEGKTSTSSNLAVAAARAGIRTVLVEADMRRPTLSKRFGFGRMTGLSDVLARGDRPVDHVVRVGLDDLVVLTSGTIPPNPHELLVSPAMQTLHEQIVARCDLVIYDSPAALAVPDALEIGRYVDLAILVGRAGVTGRRQLSAVIERLEQVGTEIAGTVLNAVNSKDDNYYYAYYIEPPTEDTSRRGRRRAKREDAPAADGVMAGRNSFFDRAGDTVGESPWVVRDPAGG